MWIHVWQRSHKVVLSLSLKFLGHYLHGNFVIVVSGPRFLLLLLEFILTLIKILLCKTLSYWVFNTNKLRFSTYFFGWYSSLPKARKAQNINEIIPLGNLKVIDWVLWIYIFDWRLYQSNTYKLRTFSRTNWIVVKFNYEEY